MSIADKISSYNRNRKWRLFSESIYISNNVKVLDVGFSDKEYSQTDNYLEKHYLYSENITALGIDEPNEFCRRYPTV